MNVKSKTLSIAALTVATIAAASVVLADMAPVVDASPSSVNTVNASAKLPGAPVNQVALPSLAQGAVYQSTLSSSQRIMQLEQQMQNFTNMNLPQQISDIQDKIQQLRGQLQVQAHDLKLLNSQQRSFYQDVDSRIAELKTLVSNGSIGSSTTSSPKKGPSKSSAKPSASNTSAAPNLDVHAKDNMAYKGALQWVLKQQFSAALTAFQKYLTDYPKGQYVANAHYWLGEIYMRQQKTKLAMSQFQIIINQYPKSNKVSDAQLKLAMIDASQGKPEQAKAGFLAIAKQYPGTTAAQLANLQLQKLKTQ
jgi:tol-pal system protein YbgF